MLAEPVLIHLQDLPGRDVEAQDGVLSKHRLLADELLPQAVLPGLPSARHAHSRDLFNRRRIAYVHKVSTSESYGG